ncbi:amidase signature domain-containing protein [Lentinula edodes]|uniref:amidase signature domain-containing protein n=1 Tax=Lentinula edodes TaxID=5353 RepID=UPI001E8E53A9|nr:amidase signature domain-containing protein [Lentinula edodes]KAH7868391.1 amidase signature domain-containing protein [Lentinula edodes]
MWPFSLLWSTDRTKARAVIEAKRAERDRLIASAPELSVRHNQFLKAGAHEIVSRIEKGDWTAREVVEAYISQAAKAHIATNCLTEVLFQQALKLAEELDAEFAVTKKLRGPLHGVPFSAKDQFNIAGFDTSIGFTTWANRPATTDAVLVSQLISLGAIPIAKTNVPQTMFSFECNNPLWGRTTNPYNSKYTCGGSSGGEAALLAMDGSAFGIGSDVGGSLRIPAAYCGVYGLKPSFGRVSKAGAQSANPAFEGIKSVTGPMARNVNDLELFCQAIFGLQDETHSDYTFVPMPYRRPDLPKRLKFGYYTADGFAKASPAAARAVMETVEALKAQDHECIEIEIPDVSDSLEIYLALVSADGYKRMTSPIGPDPMEPSLFLPVYGSRIPALIRKFGAWVVERILGDKLFAKFIRASRIKTVSETNYWAEQRNKWNTMFYEKVWNQYGLDGIICPVQAMPQIPHGGSTTVNSLVVSTALYNLVDSPVGILPVTHVDAHKDQITEAWTSPNSSKRSVLMEQRLYTAANPMYNPIEMDRMPVSVQIVGKKWEDEKVVAMMTIVDDILGPNRGFGPRGFVNHVTS